MIRKQERLLERIENTPGRVLRIVTAKPVGAAGHVPRVPVLGSTPQVLGDLRPAPLLLEPHYSRGGYAP